MCEKRGFRPAIMLSALLQRRPAMAMLPVSDSEATKATQPPVLRAFKVGLLCGALGVLALLFLASRALGTARRSVSAERALELLTLDRELHDAVLADSRSTDPIDALGESFAAAAETRVLQARSVVSGLFQALEAAAHPHDKDRLLGQSVQHAREDGMAHLDALLDDLKAEFAELSAAHSATVTANSERYRAEAAKLHGLLAEAIAPAGG